jgi:hypothetical protein
VDDCGKYRDMIDRLLDRDLSEEEEKALRAHMESCGDCRRVYDAYRAIADALETDLAEPPEDLLPGIRRRIAAGEAEKKKARTRFSSRRIGLMAACLALMIFAGYQLDRWSQNQGAANDTSATLQGPAERYGVASESGQKFASLPAEAPAAPAPEIAGAGAPDSSQGTGRVSPMYSQVRISADGRTVLESTDTQIGSALADSILIPAGEPEKAPDRAADYTVTLTTQDTGETASYEVWVDGDELRWRPEPGDDVFLSPVTSSGFLALLTGS